VLLFIKNQTGRKQQASRSNNMRKDPQALVRQLETRISQLTQVNQKLQSQVDKTNLLHEVSVSLSGALDFETIVTRAVEFSKYLGATSGEIHLLTDQGEVYFKSTYQERNVLDDVGRQTLVRRVLQEGLDGWVLGTGQLALVLDTLQDDRWLAVEYADQTVSVRSAICAPIFIDQGRLKGAISFVHPEPHHFDNQDLNLLGSLTNYLVTALENAYYVDEIKNSLDEAQLMLDINRRLSAVTSARGVHQALLHSTTAVEADLCILFTGQGLSSSNVPTHGKITFIGDVELPNSRRNMLDFRFSLEEYPAIFKVFSSAEPLVIEDLAHDERLSAADRELLQKLGGNSLVINPLVNRMRTIGLLIMAFKRNHIFTERELKLYHNLADQATSALEHVRQIEQTEQALAETQTLYRAGRVLAGLEEQQDILEEALVEFVYGLGVDQGGIVMLSPDRKVGYLMTYLEDGELKDPEGLQFPIDGRIPYQEVLLAGQPFVSSDFASDEQLVEFRTFNPENTIKSIVQAPIIMQGQTMGWLGADATREPRNFSQREVDLARAMADQVAVSIQNRRLLVETQRRAEQLRAVATVGEAVTGLTDLDQVLKLTVDLIRDSFGFYHVSVFLIDELREWAVVKASTGEVGKIMVERPHRLGVGSNSIVGFVTQNAKPRIALDVGQDAVHFNNPLLPNTHSEMALPLISRGLTIGALDVQSEVANAFSTEDVETLQIVADQVTTAIETARLFEETQHRLKEQALLYQLGTRLGSTLNLQATTDILVHDTADILDIAKCTLSLLNGDGTATILSDILQPETRFPSDRGQVLPLNELVGWAKVAATGQTYTIHVNDPHKVDSLEAEYLQKFGGSAMGIAPILLRNEIIGLLHIFDDRPGRRFMHNVLTTLDSVALLAANSIENAQLYEAAQESQSFMRAILDQIPDPIFIKDPQQKWVVINSAFAGQILGQPESNVIGATDEDFLPPEQASWFKQLSQRMFKSGQTQEAEDVLIDRNGRRRSIYVRNVPLTLSDKGSNGNHEPDYLVGIIQDITERKRREQEREELIESTRKNLERTQTLYRIGNILSETGDLRITFEKVLGEYLQLLGQKQGSILLVNQSIQSSVSEARYIDGQAVEPNLIVPLSEDKISRQLSQAAEPVVINRPQSHPLTKGLAPGRGIPPMAMLFVPLMLRSQLLGIITIDATEPQHKFSEENIEIGRAIADQLTIWLENRRLLDEARHRSDSLATAAEVSRAASSILDIEELITSSVNVIRNQFDFYYVGLFRIEENFAVLKAGTGEAGQIQLSRQHRLEIGGGSMIGWSIANRKARIALDVGDEAVHFKNPVLPDTRSEMALPLISRDEVLGALTVQSTKRLAFSNEDITLLQTMADQLANAIKNAELFTQTQQALGEAEKLYEMAQAISSARDEETVFQLAMEHVAATGVDSAAVYLYRHQASPEGQLQAVIEQKLVWNPDKSTSFPDGTQFSAEAFGIESLLPRQGPVILDTRGDDPKLPGPLHQALQRLQISRLLILPLSTHQRRIGFLLASYKAPEKTFDGNQLRFYTTMAQQMVVSLENLRLLDDSQKRARREEIIREITGKIRNATDIEDILKTTVTEVSRLAGTSHGKITLGISGGRQEQHNGGPGTPRNNDNDNGTVPAGKG
jgi:PAS domain S-box-containing protein